MKKAPLLIVLALLVFGAASANTSHVSPIQPLVKGGRNSCTASAISKTDRLWLTARHCVIGGLEGATIGGGGVTLVFIGNDDTEDIALLQSVVIPVRSFRLSKTAPNGPFATKLGDEVIIKGFPYGLTKLITTAGRIAARLVFISEDRPISDVLDASGAPGNSGSPVFNKKGEIIGLLWGGYTTTHTLIVPWEALNEKVGKYVEVK